MKTSSTGLSLRSAHGCRTGFTLLELLIVMLVIGILAAIITAAGSGILGTARKMQAKGTANELLIAIKEYHNEYGRYPMHKTKQGFDTIFGNPGDDQLYSTKDFLDILLAEPDGWNKNHELNPKRRVFFSPSTAKKSTGPEGKPVYRNGLGDDGRLYDPWGNEYLVMIDGDYDQEFGEKWFASNFVYEDAEQEFGGVIVWSYGKDGEMGRKGDKSFKGSDDVVSWK